MEIKYVEIKNRKCFYCGTVEGDYVAIQMHHARKRSTNPELIDDPDNLCPLCVRCHDKTEHSYSFLKEIQRLWEKQVEASKKATRST